jgi:hypothetical protein
MQSCDQRPDAPATEGAQGAAASGNRIRVRIPGLRAQWEAAATLDSQLPVVFRSTASLQSLDYRCSGCSGDIPGELVRGRITRPTPSTAMIEGHGYCVRCGIFVPFCAICRGERGIQMEWEADGEWFVSRARTEAEWRRLRAARRFRRAFRWLLDRLLSRRR